MVIDPVDTLGSLLHFRRSKYMQLPLRQKVIVVPQTLEVQYLILFLIATHKGSKYL